MGGGCTTRGGREEWGRRGVPDWPPLPSATWALSRGPWLAGFGVRWPQFRPLVCLPDGMPQGFRVGLCTQGPRPLMTGDPVGPAVWPGSHGGGRAGASAVGGPAGEGCSHRGGVPWGAVPAWLSWATESPTQGGEKQPFPSEKELRRLRGRTQQDPEGDATFLDFPFRMANFTGYSPPAGMRAAPSLAAAEEQRARCWLSFLDRWRLITRAHGLALAESCSMHHGLIRRGSCRVPGPGSACKPDDLILPEHLSAVRGPRAEPTGGPAGGMWLCAGRAGPPRDGCRAAGGGEGPCCVLGASQALTGLRCGGQCDERGR